MAEQTVPLWEKYALTITEAAKYFGVGENKLKSILLNDPDASYILKNGGRTLIKRAQFEAFLDGVQDI